MEDQKKLDHLQDALSSAQKDAEETRFFYSSALDQSQNEAKLYRSLFWCILAIVAGLTIVALLTR